MMNKSAPMASQEALEAFLTRHKFASTNARSKEHGRTPLHEAAEFGRDKVARPLIKKGADVKARNKSDYTPLTLAIIGDEPTTKALLKRAGGRR